MIRFLWLAAALLATVPLAGCAPPLLVAGAAAGAVGATVATDERPTAVIVEDQRIEGRIRGAINGDRSLVDGVRVSVDSYNGIVLLTGQVPDAAARGRVVAHAQAAKGVRRLHDHLEIGAPAGLQQRSRDTMLTTRIKSELVSERGLPSVHVKVISEKGNVYLMGRVSRAAAQRIGEIVQGVDGVRSIVLVFEYAS